MTAGATFGDYTAENYLQLVRAFQPRPRKAGDEGEFTDETIGTLVKGLDFAAAPFLIAGVAFPPLALVGTGIGILSSAIGFFNKQDKMVEFADRINSKIGELSYELDKGFDNLAQVITETDFIETVVSPASELFAAFNRYTQGKNIADRQELEDCYKIRHKGGMDIIEKMEEKLGLNNKTNMLQAALRAADYTQKQHIETTRYILKSLLEILCAHTFYLQVISPPETAKDDTDRFMKSFNKVVAELEKINDWKENEYFKEAVLKPIIEKSSKSMLPPDLPQFISDYLTRTYSWDRFIVVMWSIGGKDNTDDGDSFVKFKLSETHSLQFRIGTRRYGDTSEKNILIHRIANKSKRAVPIDYKARKAVGESISNKLHNDRKKEINVLDWMDIKDPLGFGFWMFFGKNQTAMNGRSPFSIWSGWTPGTKDEFYKDEIYTQAEGFGAPFGKGRRNIFIFTL